MFNWLKLYFFGIIVNPNLMNKLYYKVRYCLFIDGLQHKPASLLLQSFTELRTHDIKSYIAGKISQPLSVITLLGHATIDQDMYIALGGDAR
jgi:hypothetical protein